MSGRQGFITNHETYVYQESPTTGSSAVGLDSVAGDVFKIKVLATDGATPAGTAQFTIDPAANGNITFVPNGAGNVTISNGDLTVTAGGLTVTAGTTTLTPLNASGIVFNSALGALSTSATTNHCVQVGNASGQISSLAAATNGQLIIGSTGNDPVVAAITAGSGIGVTNGAGSITISATGGGLAWTREAASPVTIVVNHGYIQAHATPTTLMTFTLPATAALGDTVEIIGENAGGWTIAQNANQAIQFGNVATTTGVGGTLSSSNRYDGVTIKCRVAGASTIWAVTSAVGVLNVV